MNTFRRPGSGRILSGIAIVFTLLVSLLAPGISLADGGEVLAGTAVVANADGQNVKLREEPSTESAEIARFAEGTTVEIVDGPVAGDQTLWYEVEVENEAGFMGADFLEDVSTAPTPSPTIPSTPGGPVSGRATVNEVVDVRSAPAADALVTVSLPAGAVVTLTGGDQNGFVSISAQGGDGWVSRQVLTIDGATPTPVPTTPPTATATPGGEIRYVLESVNLRSGPAETFESIGTLAVGTQLTLTGEIEGQFAKVTSPLGEGWVYTQVIGPVNPNPTATVTPTVAPTITTTPTATATVTPSGTRYTLEPVNLRSGPGEDFDSVVYMDTGVPLQLLGEEQNGFVRVSTVFGNGWVAAEFIGETPPGGNPTVVPTVSPTTTIPPTVEPTVAPTTTPTVTTTPPTTTPPTTVSRWTTENVNLREQANAGSNPLGIIQAGVQVQFTGLTENGFLQVITTLGTGWIASEFLTETEPVETPTPTPTGAPSASLLSWPVRGGEWRVLQGYNGSSHQNRSSSWQYLYSIDLVRSDGSTAGQPVYAPADGTVRWIDEVSGGGSIYIGDGLAFAWFHTIVDPSLVEGGRVTKGQQIGILAPAGVAGAGSTPHLHISIWETDDEGNWSRRAIPFVGRVALGGREFPSDGSSFQWTGTIINP